MRLRQTFQATFLLAFLGSAASAGAQGADELVRSLEAHHAALESLSASFTQSFRSKATAQEIEERGRLFVRRPLLRFDYRRPDKKVFLVEEDGTTLAYVPADRSAVRSPLPAQAPHLRLLRGEAGLLDDFSVREVTLKEPAFPGSRQLKLTPKRPTAELDEAYLEVSQDGRTVHRVLVFDGIGNESDLRFDRVKENPRLDEDSFELRLPRDVKVRDLTGPVEP